MPNTKILLLETTILDGKLPVEPGRRAKESCVVPGHKSSEASKWPATYTVPVPLRTEVEFTVRESWGETNDSLADPIAWIPFAGESKREREGHGEKRETGIQSK